MSAHTPTPWRAHDAERHTIVAGKHGISVARFDAKSRPEEENDENCALALRAVNAHEALVASLAEIMGSTIDKGQLGGGYVTLSGDAMRRARAALAQAEGEVSA